MSSCVKRTGTPAFLPPACSLVVPGNTPMELMPHWEKMAMIARLNPAP